MLLRGLWLKLDEPGLPVDYAYAFLKGSRHVCNWLEREALKPLRFQADGFDRIVIAFRAQPRDDVWLNSEKVACLELPFARASFDATPAAERGAWYVARLREGLAACARSLRIPLAELEAGLDAFVAGGLRNAWVHRVRRFRQQGLRVALGCELTLSQFRLELTVERAGRVALREVILETDPDERAFAWRFDDVRLEGARLVVTSKTSQPLWQRPVAELAGPGG